MASRALTIDRLLQINKNVMKAVSEMPSASEGLGQLVLLARIIAYPASKVPNDMASPERKSHIPVFPQLSGVNGVSAASTAAV